MPGDLYQQRWKWVFTSRASNWSMIHITSSGSKDWTSVCSLASSSPTIIPLSVFGSMISNAPRASRKEKSGARMTCPTSNATHVSILHIWHASIPPVAENILLVMSSLRFWPLLVLSETRSRVISTFFSPIVSINYLVWALYPHEVPKPWLEEWIKREESFPPQASTSSRREGQHKI